MPRKLVMAPLALSTLLLTLLSPSAAYAADAQPCQLLDWSPNYPNQVIPGETMQVTSSINVACAQWRTYYSARVDLVNRSSGRLLSTSTFQIGWHPDVNATISNAATAPQTAGEWKLQLNLYIFEEGGMVGSPFKATFNIKVADANSSQPNSTSAETAAIQQEPSHSVTSLTPQATAGAVNTYSVSTETGYIAIVLAVASLLGLVALALTRKRDACEQLPA